MQTQTSASELRPAWANPSSASERVMWLNADRVLYVGLLGVPTIRTFGALSIYVSLGLPHRISIGASEWQETDFSVVPPYVGHRIESNDRAICKILIETETVRLSGLPEHIRNGCGAVDAPPASQGIRDALAKFKCSAIREYTRSEDFDKDFFGGVLPVRAIEKRIGAVLGRIKRAPQNHTSAVECADACCLSVSRFLHLFKAEVGLPFRSFRTWQRARSVLYHVTQNTNLANLALDVGYPDSTHFSHTVRQVYGLTPKSIFAGCRKLALYGSGPASASRHGLD